MKKLYIILLITLLAISCRDHDYIAEKTDADNYDNDIELYDSTQVDLANYPDWSEFTHGNSTEPQMEEVFPSNVEVKRIDLTISSYNWYMMWSDLSANYRYINSSGSDYTPVWKPCTVSYNGTDWYKVGVRFKGNSSLTAIAMSNSNEKASLKLDFDQYEDSYPALTNQRFYGFKQLNLNNNYNDNSLMREKVCSDLFRNFGLASAHTCFCALYINGDYFGVYTIVEEVDDTVIDTQFNDGSGNLYKPDDDAGSFASGTYNTNEFYLKTNTASATYSDIKALYTAINASNRNTNPTAWRNTLESVFDVDTFLKWLAANTTIQNWDTYGNMAHNYYLYNNPDNGLLTWIPWDNNEALQASSGEKSPLELSLIVTTSWPLIKYIIEQSEYDAQYEYYLQEFIDKVFVSATMSEIYSEYYTLLKSYAYAEEKGRTFLSSSAAFDAAVTTLKTHASSRNTAVTNYLK